MTITTLIEEDLDPPIPFNIITSNENLIKTNMNIRSNEYYSDNKTLALSTPSIRSPNNTTLPKQVTYIQTLDTTYIAHNIISPCINNRLYLIDQTIATAAGEEDSSIQSIWISGTYGTSNYAGHNKYSGKTYAATIGADKIFDNNSIIGIAYNYVTSDFKHKNSPDKISAKNHLISLYGQKDLSDKIML